MSSQPASLFHVLKTDADKEVEGVELLVANHKFIVARAGGGNTKYLRRLQAKLKPREFEIQQNTLDNTEAQRILAEVYADTIILRVDVRDADGVWHQNRIVAESGEMVEATPEVLTDYLIRLPRLFEIIKAKAEDFAAFRAASEEADAKN